MPAKTAKQQRYMGFELSQARKGKATKVPENVAEEFAHKPSGGYAGKKKKAKKK
jgi:hypothetical protein